MFISIYSLLKYIAMQILSQICQVHPLLWLFLVGRHSVSEKRSC